MEQSRQNNEEEEKKQIQAKEWGLVWCLGILGPQAGVEQLGYLSRPLFRDTSVRVPGFALDRCLVGSFKFDPKFLSMFSFALFGGLLGFRGQKIKRED